MSPLKPGATIGSRALESTPLVNAGHVSEYSMIRTVVLFKSTRRGLGRKGKNDKKRERKEMEQS